MLQDKTRHLEKGAVIRLDSPKQVLIHKGKNKGRKGLIQPRNALLVYGVGHNYTLLRVAKQMITDPYIRHGDIVGISHDSLISLNYKKL